MSLYESSRGSGKIKDGNTWLNGKATTMTVMSRDQIYPKKPVRQSPVVLSLLLCLSCHIIASLNTILNVCYTLIQFWTFLLYSPIEVKEANDIDKREKAKKTQLMKEKEERRAAKAALKKSAPVQDNLALDESVSTNRRKLFYSLSSLNFSLTICPYQYFEGCWEGTHKMTISILLSICILRHI